MKFQATPYLTFNGNAKEALQYYKDIFDGEISDIQTFGEADFPTPPESDDLVMHGRFKKGNLTLMFSDAFQNQAITAGNNISLALELSSEEEIQTIYSRLSEKGTILMELQDTFWGAKFAKVKDAFNVIWDLNYTLPTTSK
ncbi:VOC family protein [Chengkuizengella axinellae]|uniref:VOC family protein n=1 Tax=Chengkuizengella axinellae TaxID=3064388 RepID=A0ABT9J508_9BACL|nr:VOC family protein [Chengkuizengella sp. 2205SS18-9]MDP5276715.1 VOC family protein [Chengkuizengella sp. 2205SS18-9]